MAQGLGSLSLRTAVVALAVAVAVVVFHLEHFLRQAAHFHWRFDLPMFVWNKIPVNGSQAYA